MDGTKSASLSQLGKLRYAALSELHVISFDRLLTGGAGPAAAGAPAKTPKPAGGPPPPPPPAPPAGSMNKEREGNAQKPSGPGFSAVLSAISNKVIPHASIPIVSLISTWTSKGRTKSRIAGASSRFSLRAFLNILAFTLMALSRWQSLHLRGFYHNL